MARYGFHGWSSSTEGSGEVPSPDDDEFLIFGKRPRPRSAASAFFDEIFSERMSRSNPLLGPYLRQADTVLRYVWELLAMDVPRRRKAVRKPPFRDLLLASVLLDESRKYEAANPNQSEAMAVLAEWIALQPWPQAPEKAASLRVDARIRQGEVLTRKRDFKAAELRFGAAYAELSKLPDYEPSYFYRALGSLRATQGRIDEAAALLLHAMRVHSGGFGSQTLPAGGLVELAFLHLRRNDPGRAMTLLTDLLLNPEENPFVILDDLKIDLGRALCLAALGLAEPARELLAQSLPRRRCIEERGSQLPYEWLECRISVHLGDFDPAISRLEAILRWLSREHKLTDACLCAIDLALAHETRGTASPWFPGLLQGIRQFEIAEKPWALGSLWWFREAVDRGWEPAQAAREAANIVHLRESSLVQLADRMRIKKRRRART